MQQLYATTARKCTITGLDAWAGAGTRSRPSARGPSACRPSPFAGEGSRRCRGMRFPALAPFGDSGSLVVLAASLVVAAALCTGGSGARLLLLGGAALARGPLGRAALCAATGAGVGMPDLAPCLAAALSSEWRGAAEAPVLASAAETLGGSSGAGRRSLEGCAAADGKLLGFRVLAAKGCDCTNLAAPQANHNTSSLTCELPHNNHEGSNFQHHVCGRHCLQMTYVVRTLTSQGTP